MTKGSVLSRLAALLLLALCIALAVLFVVEPIRAKHRRYDALIADAFAQRDRFAASLRDRARLEAELAALKRSRSTDEIYLPEANPSLAGAALIGRINRLIGEQGGTLISSQILGAPEKGAIPSVAVRAHMRVSIDALAVILHRLETGYPSVFLDDVRINARTVPRAARVRAGSSERPGDVALEVTCTVTGFLRPAVTQ